MRVPRATGSTAPDLAVGYSLHSSFVCLPLNYDQSVSQLEPVVPLCTATIRTLADHGRASALACWQGSGWPSCR